MKDFNATVWRCGSVWGAVLYGVFFFLLIEILVLNAFLCLQDSGM